MENQKGKLAILLPGIGYTCDKPLLYYSGKLARSMGLEVLPVPYSGFPSKVRGDRKRMVESFEIALGQTEEMLRDVEWKRYEEIVFISKSIGTIVAASYASARHLPCRHIFFTPLADTFSFPVSDAIAFHGTSDPWADTAKLRALCEEAKVPLYITENANHSLETGDVLRDIRNLEGVMQNVKGYLEPRR